MSPSRANPSSVLDRVDYYLTLWAASKRKKHLGLGCKTSKFFARARVQGYEDLDAEGYSYAVRTMDGIIESLGPYQENAIHVYHLGATWRFPGIPLDECYLDARANLITGLNRWGLP